MDPYSRSDRFGICQWFHLGDRRQLESTLQALDDLGVRHLRTGISWADFHRPGGQAWYDWQMKVLAEVDVEVLLSVWHTPPSISLDPPSGRCSVPPDRSRDYADFLDVVVDRWGDAFEAVEIWNEPNNPYKWDPAYDPDLSHFAEMAIAAGHWMRERGKTAVLGGMCLMDLAFVERMDQTDTLNFMDVLGIHAFPDMWRPFCSDWDHPRHWYGWEHRVEGLSAAAGDLPVWVTETGVATWRDDLGRRGRERLQVERLLEALDAPAERVYWYCLFDLAPDRTAIEESNGGPREEAEYHMGLVRHDPRHRIAGNAKPAYHALRDALREGEPAGRGNGAAQAG